MLGRWGGDEFVVVTKTAVADWLPLAERLEALVALSPLGATVSCGFGVWGLDGVDWSSCYEAADRRLYLRKAGRKLRSSEDLTDDIPA